MSLKCSKVFKIWALMFWGFFVISAYLLFLFFLVFLNFLAFVWLLSNTLLLLLIFNVDAVVYPSFSLPFMLFTFWLSLYNWLCVSVSTHFGLRWAYFSESIIAGPTDYLFYACFGTIGFPEGKLRNWLGIWLYWVSFYPLL